MRDQQRRPGIGARGKLFRRHFVRYQRNRVDISRYRRGAHVRWRQKREWATVDAAKQAKLEEEAEAWGANARWLEEMLERARNLPRPEPRIRFL